MRFQKLATAWCKSCFGEAILKDKKERSYRFLEEAIELAQACSCDEEQAHELVKYVFSRPAGVPYREIGGVMVTLAVLCETMFESMEEAGIAELARNIENTEKIRVKGLAKRTVGPSIPGK